LVVYDVFGGANGSETDITNPPIAATSLSVAVPLGETWTFKVRAMNSRYVFTDFMSNSLTTTSCVLPQSPQNLKVSFLGGVPTISWDTVTETGGVPLTGYIACISKTGECGTINASTLTHSFMPVTLGFTSVVSVRAFTVCGMSDGNSGKLNILYAIAPAQPAPAPLNTAASYSPPSLTFIWTAPASNGSPIIQYTFQLYKVGTLSPVAS